MTKKPPKPRKCKVCRETFQPVRQMQAVCSVFCSLQSIAKKREKDEAEKAKAEKRADRAKAESLKTVPQLLREAQREFNRFIRFRDAGRDCICCPGVVLPVGSVGGGFDAGHYRSVGSASHLRFDESNAHGQRKQCNRWGAGRAVDYRIGLIGRIGLAAVEALEQSSGTHKWEREEVRLIRDYYRAKANALAKEAK